jgi:hypothetical protein
VRLRAGHGKRLNDYARAHGSPVRRELACAQDVAAMKLSDLKYVRNIVFFKLLKPFSARRRAARMAAFEQELDLKPGTRVLDLGGEALIWLDVKTPLDITLLNLPGNNAPLPERTIHSLRSIEGDGCHVDAFASGSFDILFSNSTIEHVGPPERQEAFAREARRLGRSYWVQTPSIWFPIEAHTGMPLWWLWPERLRSYFVRGWKKNIPSFGNYIEETRVLSKRRMQELFPEARIDVERFCGFTKSYVAKYIPAQGTRSAGSQWPPVPSAATGETGLPADRR